MAFGVVLALVFALFIAAPYADRPWPGGAVLLPAYATAVLMTELITAALLFALYAVQRSAGLLALSVGYLFTALMMVPWALTFPGVFAPTGLLGASLQSTAALAAVRRVGFPLFVLAYALLKDRPAGTHAPARAVVLGSAAAAVAGACGVTALAVADSSVLPHFMANRMQAAPLWQAVPFLSLLACLMGLAVLGWRWRHRSVLDLWLVVVLVAWSIETILLGFVGGGRFSVGWWAGRVYGLAASSVVLLVLLSEITTLYSRIVRSVAAERRVREARLASLEALSAAIAHEVNQPLTSMVTSADAGLRWLNRPDPALDEVRAALARIAAEGHRAARVIACIRAAFRKSPQERVPLDINALITDTLKRTQSDRRENRVSAATDVDEELPRIGGNPVQIQQVLLNLVTNAIEAMSPVADRPRVLRVRSTRHGPGTILVAVEDTGTGLKREQEERLFEPFFTTKPQGIGMGLTICQSIVEAHGGRLWMTANAPHGAVFQFTLPVDEDMDRDLGQETGRDHSVPATERAQ